MNDVNTWYGFLLQQMAAEVYFDEVSLAEDADVRAALRRGNNRPGFQEKGVTRLTEVQINDFLHEFEAIQQASDNPASPRATPLYFEGTTILANTGLSATLIQKRGTNEFTLSIRSTEFQNWANGGDRERDGFGADIAGIFGQGFAFAQIDALDRYYHFLKSTINPATGQSYIPEGATLNVTGYSLGGHLATVFTELHVSEINRTYIFNGAGRGTWDESQGDLRSMLEYYRSVIGDPDYADVPLPDDSLRYTLYLAAKQASGILDPLNIYRDPRYKWAAEETQRHFRTVGLSSPLLLMADPDRTGLSGGADSKITQIYGEEFPSGTGGVANSGVHGPAVGVFIEAQPFLAGWPDFVGGAGDFGNGHSIVLIADSLAVMRAYQQLDPNVSLESLNSMFAAASNKRAVSAIVGAPAVEDDALETALDPLRRLLVATDVGSTAYVSGARGFGDPAARNGFYTNVQQLVASPAYLQVAGHVHVVDISANSAANIQAAAEEDVAYRYALKELNPFAILDPERTGVYERFGDAFDLYDPLEAPKGLTQQYIEDRAAFFERKFYITTRNLDKFYQDPITSDPNRYPNAPDAQGEAYQREAKEFQDRDSGFIASTGDNPNSLQHFIFGGAGADLIQGAGREDHLYGGEGPDVLVGGAGADYLEGGVGFDVYRLSSGDGEDTIFDADGEGLLLRNGTQLALGIKQADGRWSLNGATYTRSGSDLDVTFAGSSDRLTIKDFNFAQAQATRYDGIRLAEVQSAPVNIVRTFFGDKENYDSDPAQPGIQLIEDAFGNTVRADGQAGRPDSLEADRPDFLRGSNADEVERFLTAGGDDTVYGDGDAGATSTQGGSDWIETGAGRDIVAAGADDDWIEGGSETDILAGNLGNDVLWGGDTNGQTLILDQAIAAGQNGTATTGTADLLSGDAGDDLLVGDTGADLLNGGTGADIIVAGAGDDTVYADASLLAADPNWAITRSGGIQERRFVITAANLRLSEDASIGGVDVIYGGAGKDWMFAGAGNDYVDGGIDDDALYGEGGDDVLIGGAGRDVLVGDSLSGFITAGTYTPGADYLDGGAGNDLLQGDEGDDILIGGTGNDELNGGPGKDTYFFNAGDGRDILFDELTGAEASVLVFGEGFNPNNLTIRPGSMILDFGTNDSVELASFDPYVADSPAAFQNLVFGDGTRLSFNDVLNRGFVVYGTEDDDNAHDAAHPVLRGTAYKDSIHGLGGNDELQGWEGADALDGGAGDDRLFGMDGNDVLLGGAGRDAVVGGDGDDVLQGGDGRDALWGDAGNDLLDGGAGQDRLDGGTGDDSYMYGAGDSVFDYSGNSTVIFGPGIAADDLSLSKQLSNGLPKYVVGLSAARTDDQRMSISLSEDAQLAAFQFDDGTVLDHEALLHATWTDGQIVAGTSFDDLLTGYAGTDLIIGGDGNDTALGLRGDDSLRGEAGDDVLDGGVGNDLLDGGAGRDTLVGGLGNDRLLGGEGGDTYIVGRGDGNDVIAEGPGSGDVDVLVFTDVASNEVTLTHQANGDLIAVVAGAGSVTVIGYYLAAEKKIERIDFADGISIGRTTLDAITVPPIVGTPGDDNLVGTPYADTLQGGTGIDTLDGGAGNDVLDGGAGVDTFRLRPDGNTDSVVEDGSDLSIVQLDAGWVLADLSAVRQGKDLLISLTNGNSTFLLPGYYSGQTNWVIRTDAGEEKTAAELIDYLASIQPPTTVEEFQAAFLAGARQKYAAYLATWNASGSVVVNDQPSSDAATILVSVPSGETSPGGLVAHLNFAHVVAGGSANLLDFRGARNTISDGGAGNDVIDNDGSAFTFSLATTNDTSIGSFLYGNDGNDTVFGTWSNDMLLGGNGEDYLAGSQGNDTYVVLSSDSGTKVIDEVNAYLSIGGRGDNQPGRFSADTLRFADVPYSNVTFSIGRFDSTSTSSALHGQVFATLDMAWGTGGTVRLLLPDPNNPALFQFPGESYGVEQIGFSDGISLNQSQILQELRPVTTGLPGSDVSIPGTDGDDLLSVLFPDSLFRKTTLTGFAGNDLLGGGLQNDVLYGGDGDDQLYGDDGDDILVAGAGNDVLNGGYGNDLIDGGAGDDTLSGGIGDDAYVFDRGFGRDVIQDDRGPLNLFHDVIRFGEGISPTDIRVTRDDANLYLQMSRTSDRITLNYETPDGFFVNNGVDRVEFYDGTVWSRNDLFARIASLPATDLDDPVWGSEAGETLHGLDGNDRIMGLDGDDQLFGDAGDDAVYGWAGDDVSYGNEGNDDVEGGDGNDVLYGNVGDDYLEGDAGDDILIGGDGNDDLEEWEGTNFINAGTGDDYVYTEAAPSFVIGGAGDDWIDVYGPNSVLAFNRGDGHDTAYANQPFTLSLGGGITASDLTLQADGPDILLGTGAGESVRFTRQNEADIAAWPELRLQVITDRVSVYDLRSVVDACYSQVPNHPDLVLMLDAVLPAYVMQTTVDQAYGGDLAYQYARGRLAESLSQPTVLPVIGDSSFGLTAQAVSNAEGLAISGGDNGSVVTGTRASEQIVGGEGADWLDGDEGDDTLTGAGGDDLLTGGPGSDTYIYNRGDGVDTIADATLDGQTNTVAFGPGISADEITLGLGSLLIRIGTSGGAIHLTSFNPDDPYGVRDVDTFNFTDGSVITYEQLIGKGFDLLGTSSADTITGTAAVDRITGGVGDDALSGGFGSDIYFYSAGDGADTIVEVDDPASTDAIHFNGNIAPGDVRVVRSGDDVLLKLPSASDRLTLKGWFTTPGGTIEQVQFGNGTAWTAADLESHIAAIDQPPQLITPIPHQSAAEDSLFTYAVPAEAFIDLDAGDTLSYSANVADGSALPVWLSFDPQSRTFGGTPQNGDVGNVSIRVTVTDTSGATAFDDFELTVTNTNDAPTVVKPLADGNATEDTFFAFVVPAGTFADADAGDRLTYSADQADGSPLPSWLTFDATTRTLSGTPANDDVGSTDIRLTATDLAGASASDVFTVMVRNTNDAPVTAADQVGVVEDGVTRVAGNVLANDKDLDALDTLSVAPATLASAYGSLALAVDGTFVYTLANDSLAVQSLGKNDSVADVFGYSASDGSASVAGTLTVSIAGANDAPVLAVPVENQTPQVDSPFTLLMPKMTFTDIDRSDFLSYSARRADGSSLPTWISFDAASLTLSGTPAATDAGTIQLRITATDSAGAAADTMFSLTVEPRIVDRAFDFQVYGAWPHGAHRTNPETRDVISIAGLNRTTAAYTGSTGTDTLHGTASGDAILLDDGAAPSLVSIEMIDAGSGDDVVDLTSKRYSYGDVTVNGGSENDVLWTNIGNDVLDGGAGDDELAGGAGNDVYVHGANGGDDLITEAGGQDTIRFSDGIAARDMAVSRHGNDLLLSARGNGTVTVDAWFRDGAHRVEKVVFGDGTAWGEAELSMRANAAIHEHDGAGTSGDGAGRPRAGRDADEARDRDDRSKDASHPSAAQKPAEDAAGVIAALLAKQPVYDFNAVADYLSKHYDDSAGRPLSTAEISRQWATLQRYTAALVDIDPYAAEAAQSHGFADDLLHVAASGIGWGFDGSIGSVGTQAGMKALNGLSEGFQRLG